MTDLRVKTHVYANSGRRHFIGGSDTRIIMGNDEDRLLLLWKEKRGEIDPFKLHSRRIDHWKPEMGIRCGPAMPWNVLEHRQNPALFQPFRHRSRDRRDFLRLGSVGAVANHRIGAGNRHVRQRQAIHRDAGFEQVGGDQPRAQARRGQAK